MEFMVEKDAIGDIRKFGTFMGDAASRSLALLNSISRTVTAMQTIESEARGFVRLVESLCESVSTIEGPIPEDVVATFEGIQDSLAAVYRVMRMKHDAAKADARLRDDDGVCDAYRGAMDQIHQFNECVEKLRWHILEHNADTDTSDGTVLSDPEEIERYLASL